MIFKLKKPSGRRFLAAKVRALSGLAGLGLCMIAGSAAATASGPNVVVSLLPIHSLVAGVMAGVGQPQLLFPAGTSPHVVSLRPSQMRKLSQADLIIRVGEGLETTLNRPLRAVQGKVIDLAKVANIEQRPARGGGEWSATDQEDDHAHDADHPDLHLWLDPANASVIVQRVSEELARMDGANAARYQINAAALQARLDALDMDLRRTLAPVQATAYVVFHDAYQYFEKRYGLSAVGAVAVSPDRPPGAKRVRRLRARVKALEARCVFSEPQFPSNLVSVLVEGSTAKTGVLDPMGATLIPGPDAYFQLMRNLAAGLSACLLPSPNRSTE